MAQYINSYLCFVQPVNPFKTIIMSSYHHNDCCYRLWTSKL